MRRPVFRLPPSSLDQLFEYLRLDALPVAPKIAVTASPHEANNRFLECAEAAGAEYLVTGNKWKGTKIVNARELLLEAFH